jgi:hypothetical protein
MPNLVKTPLHLPPQCTHNCLRSDVLKPIPYCQMEYQENVARQLHSDSQTCITKGRGAKHDINEICYQIDSKHQHRTLF